MLNRRGDIVLSMSFDSSSILTEVSLSLSMSSISVLTQYKCNTLFFTFIVPTFPEEKSKTYPNLSLGSRIQN